MFTANGRIGVQVQPMANNYSLVKLCERVALITKALKRSGKGGRRAKVQAGYFGFNDRESALKFAAVVSERFGIECFVRSAQRLSSVPLEVKVRDFDGLEQLAWEKARNVDEKEREEAALDAIKQVRASLPDIFYDANDSHSKRFYTSDGQWIGVSEESFECYSHADWVADQEDLRSSSSSF